MIVLSAKETSVRTFLPVPIFGLIKTEISSQTAKLPLAVATEQHFHAIYMVVVTVSGLMDQFNVMHMHNMFFMH